MSGTRMTRIDKLKDALIEASALERFLEDHTPRSKKDLDLYCEAARKRHYALRNYIAEVEHMELVEMEEERKKRTGEDW